MENNPQLQLSQRWPMWLREHLLKTISSKEDRSFFRIVRWNSVQDQGRADQVNQTPYLCPHGPKLFGSSWLLLETSRPMLHTDSWWRHQMETFSALLAICAGNSPITGEFPAQRPVARSVDVFFYLRLNKRLSKHSWGWWFETPYYDVIGMPWPLLLSLHVGRQTPKLEPSALVSCDTRWGVQDQPLDRSWYCYLIGSFDQKYACLIGITTSH